MPEILPDRWTALAAFAPPPFAAEALRRHGLRLLGAVARTIRSGALVRAAPPRWPDARGALAAVHGFGRATSCLAVQPDCWTTFHEPQITGGLAYFLDAGSPALRRARMSAVFTAADAALPRIDPDRIDHATATAEAPLAGGRIDLLVRLRLADGGTRCLLVEAKFGHVLGEGQLCGYQAALAAERGLASAEVTRLVVAPALTERLRAGLRESAGWRFLTWAQFLLRLDAALPPEADDADFRRFRRTIWHRAHA